MASKYWIKVYHEILDDPKMGRMPDHLWRRTIELFLVAGEEDAEGLLPKLCDMAYRLRVTDDELTKDLDELEKLGVIHKEEAGWVVTRFAERQAPVSDAERMRRYRERQRDKNYYGDDDDTHTVTSTVTKRSQIRLDKNRLDDTDGEGDFDDADRSPLLELFERETKIIQPSELIDAKGFMSWEKEVAKWESMGVTKADVLSAVKKADELKSNLSWPGSITKYMASSIARQRRGVPDAPPNNNGKHGPDPYPDFGIVYDENGVAYNAKGEVVNV